MRWWRRGLRHPAPLDFKQPPGYLVVRFAQVCIICIECVDVHLHSFELLLDFLKHCFFLLAHALPERWEFYVHLIIFYLFYVLHSDAKGHLRHKYFSDTAPAAV